MKNSDRHNLFFPAVKPFWYLIAGIITLSLSHTAFGIDILGWTSAVPFLLYLQVTKGWKPRMWFVAALFAAWSLAVLKIISPPVPYIMIFLFSVPFTLFHLPAYLIWDRFKNHRWAVLVFPSVFVIMEWIQYSFTPFASWGISAYTQSKSLVIMQSVSLFGLSGLSFVIYWINVSLAQTIFRRKKHLISFHLPVLVLFSLLIFGSLRIDLSKSSGYDTIKVAAVGTDSEVSGLPLPSEESNENAISKIFEKTRLASEAGAELVVWNEASFYVLPQDEKEISERIKVLTDVTDIAVIASYVMPVSENPLRYENKYLLVNSGEIVFSYLKHQPVPGEPAVKGIQPVETAMIGKTRVGGVICYDYDFPYLAAELGDLNADVVAVPSSDWRGIDPLHTRMAAFRAIEQGHSIIRSTRFGLSAAISPYGEFISQMSSFDINNRILIADLPAKGTKTIYSVIGDSLVYLCIAFVIFFFLKVFRRKHSGTE